MHLFIELITLAFFLLTVGHALGRRGRAGAWLMGSLLVLGYVRESFVILARYLYGFADLHLMLGPAPVIAAVIWGYSIYAAVCWAEGVSDEDMEHPSPRFLVFVGLFMVSLACFYEPFLALIEMARWEDGTRKTLDVPWIALIGYPTLAIPFIGGWSWTMGRFHRPLPRASALGALTLGLALVHAAGLQALKDFLGW